MTGVAIRPGAGRLAGTGAVVVVGAAAVNVVLALVFGASLRVDRAFLPLQLPPVVVVTVGATLLGHLALVGVVLLGRRRFLTAFLVGTWTLAVASLAAPVLLAAGIGQMVPGTTVGAALSLIPLHLVPAIALTLGARRLAPGASA